MTTRHPRLCVEAVCFVVIAIVLCPLSIRVQSQNSQAPDLQQLKNKLQKLEEEMQELKNQINAAEQAQKSPTAAPSSAYGPQGQPQTVPLEGEVKEKKNTIDFYGFVMLDSGYEFKQQDPNWFDVVRPTKLPSFKDEFAPDGNVYASVRQTRFGVKSSMPTKFGDLKTIFEFELFGTGVDHDIILALPEQGQASSRRSIISAVPARRTRAENAGIFMATTSPRRTLKRTHARCRYPGVNPQSLQTPSCASLGRSCGDLVGRVARHSQMLTEPRVSPY